MPVVLEGKLVAGDNRARADLQYNSTTLSVPLHVNTAVL